MIKKITLFFSFSISVLFLQAQFNIGSNTKNPYAVLQLQGADSSQGLIIPYVTTINRPSASDTTQGMIIFNLNDSILQYCDGESWLNINPTSITDRDGDTRITVEETDDEDKIKMYTNNGLAIAIQNSNNWVGIGTETPLARFHVFEPSWGSMFMARSDGKVLMGGASASSARVTVNGGFVTENTSLSQEHFRVAGFDGNVGLSTSAPARKFHVHNDVSGTDSSLVITRAGNIGIGTTNPINKIDIIGIGTMIRASGNDAALRLNGTGTKSQIDFANNNVIQWTIARNQSGGRLDFKNPSNEIVFAMTDAGRASIGNNPSATIGKFQVTLDEDATIDSVFTITQKGYVGIGSTTADNPLHITSNTDPIKLEGLQNDASLDTIITVDPDGVLHKTSASDIGSSTSWSLTGNSGTSSATNFIGTTDGQHFIVKSNNSERIRIQNNGLIGIHTSSPTVPVEIGTGRPILLDYNGTSGQYGVILKGGPGGWSIMHGFEGSAGTNHGGFGGYGGGDNFTRYYIGSYSSNEVMSLLKTGNIGIGTIAPTAKLHIRNDVSGADSTVVITHAGFVGIGTSLADNPLHIISNSDPVKLEGVINDVSTDTILTLDASGIVHKRSISSIADSINSSVSDHDWYEVGGSSPPNAITDNIFTQGNVGIGTNPSAPLHVSGNAKFQGTTTLDIQTSISSIGELPAGAGITTPANSIVLLPNVNSGTVGDKIAIGYFSAGNPGWRSAFEIANSAGSRGDMLLMKTGGNVGIGSASPSRVLDIVYPAASGDDGIRISGGGGIFSNIPLKIWDKGTGPNNINIVEFGHNSTYVSGARIYSENPAASASTGANLALITASDNAGTWNSNQLVLNRSGNIGIGTNTPGTALDIVGTISANTIQRRNLSATRIELNNSDLRLYRSNNAIIWDGQDLYPLVNNIRGLGTQTNRWDSLWVSGAAMVSGKIGIGTPSPDTTLHIEGSLKMVDGNQANGYILQSDANGVGSWVDPSLITAADDGDWVLDSDTLYSAPDSTVVIKGGKVGIGTTQPTASLEVTSGDVYISPTSNGSSVFRVNNAASNPVFNVNTSATQIEIGTNKSYLSGAFSAALAIQPRSSHNLGTLIAAHPADQSDNTKTIFRVTDNTFNTPWFNITGGGNIGIGTSIPASQFHIHNDASGNDSAFVVTSAGNIGVGTTNPTSMLHIKNPDGVTKNLINIQSDNHSYFSVNHINGVNNIPLSISGYDSSRHVMLMSHDNQSGQVGTMLYIQQSSNSTSVSDALRLRAKRNAILIDSGTVRINSGGVPGGQYFQRGYGDGSDVFRVDATTTSGASFVIEESGEVGLGTSNPTNLLHINGTTDPIKIIGLVSDATLDTVITVDANGILHKTASNQLTTADDEDWVLDGDTLYSAPDSTLSIKNGKVNIGNDDAFSNAKLNIYQNSNDFRQGIKFSGTTPNGNFLGIGTDGTNMVIGFNTNYWSFYADRMTNNASSASLANGNLVIKQSTNTGIYGYGSYTFSPTASGALGFLRSINTYTMTAAAYSADYVGSMILTNAFNISGGASTPINTLNIAPTINQTGGSNGTSRGIYINPTLTSAADYIALQSDTGNVIINRGNVGIGTDDPAVKLHIYDDNVNPVLRISRAGFPGTPSTQLSHGYVGTFGTDGFQIYAGSVSRMLFHNTGYITMSPTSIYSINTDQFYLNAVSGFIGINTSSPTELFHIDAASDSLQIDNLASGILDNVLMHDPSTGKVVTGTIASINNSNVRTEASAYTLTTDDDVVLCNTSGGGFTATLPTASGNTGKKFTIKKYDTSVNVLVIDGDGAETIDGAATVSLTAAWQRITVISDGSNWAIID